MDKQYVSRGGIKLQAAISNFKLEIKNFVVLDVGSSTGGFVDCLLQNGAQKVYALDTAYGELAWKLRNDPRVIVLERTNVLWILGTQVQDDVGMVDLVTVDAGWTKLELVLPIIQKCLKPEGIIIALLKPQYEAAKSDLVKGVVEAGLVEEIKDQVIGKIKELGFQVKNQMESPILGGGGNKEYLVLISNG